MEKPATAFPEIVYNNDILGYVSASSCSLNRLNLWLLFFADFLMVRALLKKNTKLNYWKRFGIF